jgi:hypothetical protein
VSKYIRFTKLKHLIFLKGGNTRDTVGRDIDQRLAVMRGIRECMNEDGLRLLPKEKKDPLAMFGGIPPPGCI